MATSLFLSQGNKRIETTSSLEPPPFFKSKKNIIKRKQLFYNEQYLLEYRTDPPTLYSWTAWPILCLPPEQCRGSRPLRYRRSVYRDRGSLYPMKRKYTENKLVKKSQVTLNVKTPPPKKKKGGGK